MRLHCYAFIATLVAAAGAVPGAKAQDVDIHVTTALDCSVGTSNCRYWEPATYDPQSQYPLVIWLHGAGESGTDSKHLQSFAGLLTSFLDQDTGKPVDPTFVMAPQCNCDLDNEKWVNWPWVKGAYSITAVPESPAMKMVLTQIDLMRTRYNIDPDRIYVTGVSMGGFGAWDLISRHPDLIAAASPAVGGGAPDAAPFLKNAATWAYHNADDGSVPVSGDREMFAALARAGSRPTYTEGANGGHTDGGNSGNADFRPWLFAQRRGVPGTSVPEMTFSPEGGAVSQPVTITLSSTLGSNIRYTTDGSIPSSNSGTQYTGPFTLNSSAVVIAVASAGGRSVFHAAPFQVGDTPLPPGAELMGGGPPPVPPPVGGVGGGPGTASGGSSSGGAATGSGGSASGLGGRAPVGPAPSSGVGGMLGGAEPLTGGTSGMAPPGASTGAAPGSNANQGAISRKPSGGCMASPASHASAGSFFLVALGLLALQRRKKN